jgi:hypothetical protein
MEPPRVSPGISEFAGPSQYEGFNEERLMRGILVDSNIILETDDYCRNVLKI